jgi:transposase
LAGDKAYSNPRIRQWLRQHGIKAIIPQKSDEIRRHRGRPVKFDRDAYRQRNVVERCIGWLKEYRRIATRYEKLAINYLGMLKLAMLKKYMACAFPNRA